MITNQPPTDQKLLLLMKESEGGHTAYRMIFDRHWQRVYNLIYKRLKNTELAEDMTQDIFMKLWLRRQEVQIDNLSAYLATASRYAVYRCMEKQHIFVPVEDLVDVLRSQDSHTDAPLLIKEFFLAFEKTVGTMPPARQEIFRMHYIDGMNVSHIAMLLGISEKTVRNQLGRALQAFKILTLVCFIAEPSTLVV
jgi:RNA polymerase sigma factor (sigma-70 family)